MNVSNLHVKGAYVLEARAVSRAPPIVLKIKMFAEGWVVYPRTSGSPEPTWHEARSAECQVGSGDPRGLGYTTQPSANILIFIIAHVLQLINTI